MVPAVQVVTAVLKVMMCTFTLVVPHFVICCINVMIILEDETVKEVVRRDNL